MIASAAEQAPRRGARSEPQASEVIQQAAAGGAQRAAGERSSQDRHAAGGAHALLLLSLLLTWGCSSSGVVPAGSPLEPVASLGARVPEKLERAAHDVAAAALVAPGPEPLREPLRNLEAIEHSRRALGDRPSGLLPLGMHVRNATLPDSEAARAATYALLDRDDLDPGLRRLLEQELADDPLLLADDRLADARRSRLARTFNTLAAPLGRSLLGAALAPLRVTRALVALAVRRHLEEPISVPERQALAHWKRHLDAHPGQATPELLARVDALQRRWTYMKRHRSVSAARAALERDQPALAFVLAERALRYVPEDGQAERLRHRAEARLLREREARRRSLGAADVAASESSDPRVRALALALLRPDARPADVARHVIVQGPDPSLDDVARFVLASAAGESGDEAAMWDGYRELAHRGPEHSFMARHAETLLQSSASNPYAAFERARKADRRSRRAWLMFGPLSAGPRDLDLPEPLEWLIEAPTLLEALAGMPNRLVRMPWMPPSASAAAWPARRYLAQSPGGEHAEAVRAWLIEFERERGNPSEAHRIALEQPGFEAAALATLAEEAASQGLHSAEQQVRRDVRLALFRHTASEYPETVAGRDAGRRAREEVRAATAQRIRISRGFLQENPELLGPAALGLQPELMDGSGENGELHPEGILLLGGRTLEFALIGEDGENGPPRRVRRHVSEERLARLVAWLDEIALRQALIDPDVELEPDADRDLFFERARLGVTGRLDARPAAYSGYVFLSARERYGMVRKRESILPVELVLQGSIDDLGLGAYPRLRHPKPTPDAILYR